MPVALAPVLGNPLALAAFGLDRSASLPDQARTHRHPAARRHSPVVVCTTCALQSFVSASGME